MFRGTFIEFLLIAVLALVITFILFRVLESWAKGKSAVAKGTIEYGGALAGFVLVFFALTTAYGRFVASGDSTPVQVGGEYRITLHRADGQTRTGQATIRQMSGSAVLDISGEVVSVTTPPAVSFSSIGGRLNGRKLVFIYENSRNEMGLALGHITQDRPQAFTLNYFDVTDSDTNLDLEGRMVFERAARAGR